MTPCLGQGFKLIYLPQRVRSLTNTERPREALCTGALSSQRPFLKAPIGHHRYAEPTATTARYISP
jgi:hypothetical protein